MKLYCSKCGSEVILGSKCHKCGSCDFTSTPPILEKKHGTSKKDKNRNKMGRMPT